MPTNRDRFSTIDLAELFSVSGGCGKKQRACCPSPQPQAAPQAPASPSGDLVSTSVSIGYGQQ